MDTYFDRVERLAKYKGISIRSLCGMLQVSYNSWNGRKKNGTLPRLDEAEKVAQILETSLDYLQCGRINQTVSESEDVTSVCEAVRKMKERDLYRLQGWLAAQGYQTWEAGTARKISQQERAG